MHVMKQCGGNVELNANIPWHLLIYFNNIPWHLLIYF